jgi:hypothetical protein
MIIIGNKIDFFFIFLYRDFIFGNKIHLSSQENSFIFKRRITQSQFDFLN